MAAELLTKLTLITYDIIGLTTDRISDEALISADN